MISSLLHSIAIQPFSSYLILVHKWYQYESIKLFSPPEFNIEVIFSGGYRLPSNLVTLRWMVGIKVMAIDQTFRGVLISIALILILFLCTSHEWIPSRRYSYFNRNPNLLDLTYLPIFIGPVPSPRFVLDPLQNATSTGSYFSFSKSVSFNPEEIRHGAREASAACLPSNSSKEMQIHVV